MDHDVELIRDLLLTLEGYQTSPRSVIIVSSDVEAEEMGRSAPEIESGLARLLELDYIDGPGADEPGFFLFRKLTRKGIQFVRAANDPRDWERMKRHYAERRLEWRADQA